MAVANNTETRGVRSARATLLDTALLVFETLTAALLGAVAAF